MITLFRNFTDELHICNIKTTKYQGINSIALYVISCLLLFIGIVSTYQVSASENKVQDNIYGAVQSKAIENKAPAFATEAASRLIKRSTDLNKALQLLNWSDIDGFQVTHVLSEKLSKIQELAVDNELAVQAAMQIPKNTSSIQVDASELSSSGFIEGISYTCLVGIDGQVKNDMYFTVSSGGSIPVTEACRLFAWVFAANGIRFTRSEQKPRTLILDYVGNEY